MTLRITKQSDPITVETLTVCVYGQPGIGKTSLGFTAERPLCLDFDAGAYRSAYRKDSVLVATWDDVATISREDLEPYATVLVDTVGRALDQLTSSILDREPKLGYGGALTLQGYGQLKARFVAWLTLLRSYGKDVVLLAHSNEQPRGDDLIERLDVQGGSKTEVYKCADAMGRLSIAAKRKWLDFSPTDIAFGKNPGGFERLEVPDFSKVPNFLAAIIDETKTRLNAQSEAAIEAEAKLKEWRESFEQLSTAAEFTKQAEELSKQDAEAKVKGLLVAAAKKKGFTWSKKDSAFAKAKKEAAA